MASPIRSTLEYLGLVDPNDNPNIPVLQEVVYNTPSRLIPRNKNQNSVTPNEIVTLHPKQYSDVRIVAENFREGIPVIMNLSQVENSEARRIIDFASGLAQGLYGTIERVTSKVFLLSPEHLIVSGDQAAETAEVDTTFFRSN